MDDLAGALGRLGDAGPAAPGGAGTAQPPAATIAGLSSAIGAQGGIDPILDKLKSGQENLDILCWAAAHNVSCETVRHILEALDINSLRLYCKFEPLTK